MGFLLATNVKEELLKESYDSKAKKKKGGDLAYTIFHFLLAALPDLNGRVALTNDCILATT
jgi:hypothetical protein